MTVNAMWAALLSDDFDEREEAEDSLSDVEREILERECINGLTDVDPLDVQPVVATVKISPLHPDEPAD